MLSTQFSQSPVSSASRLAQSSQSPACSLHSMFSTTKFVESTQQPVFVCLEDLHLAQTVLSVTPEHVLASADRGEIASTLEKLLELLRTVRIPLVGETFTFCVKSLDLTVRNLYDVLGKKNPIHMVVWELQRKANQFSRFFQNNDCDLPITKTFCHETQQFCKENFDSRPFIPFDDFVASLTMGSENPMSVIDKDTIRCHHFGLNGDRVSIFEIEKFFAYFGPVQGSLQRALDVSIKSNFMGYITSEEAVERLRASPPGTYLTRYSKSHDRAFAVSFMDRRTKQVKHVLLHLVDRNGKRRLLTPTLGDDNSETFETLQNVIVALDAQGRATK